MERYLASEIKGIGPMLARRIVEHFGDESRRVLDNAPERLHEVSGVWRRRCAQIAAAWRDSSGLRELTVFLRGHGIAAAHARRIHEFYGKEALDVVKRDPYVLARTIHGIGFRTADAVAEKLGIPRNSIQRARAAMVYLLERMADEGHVFSPFEYLEGQFRSALEMEPELAREALNELVSGEAVVEKTDGHDGGESPDGAGAHTAVYLERLHEAEVNVAERIQELNAGRAMQSRLGRSRDGCGGQNVRRSHFRRSRRARSMRLAEPRDGYHRRSRHRQDHAAAFAAGRAG